MSMRLPTVPFDIASYTARRAARTEEYRLKPGEVKRVGSLRVEHVHLPAPAAPNLHPARPQEELRNELTTWKIYDNKHSVHSMTQADPPLSQEQFEAIKPFYPDFEHYSLQDANQAVLANTGTTGRGHAVENMLLKRQNPVTLNAEYAKHLTKTLYPGNVQMTVSNIDERIRVTPNISSDPSNFSAFVTPATMYAIPETTKKHPSILKAEEEWTQKDKDLEAAKATGDPDKIALSKSALTIASKKVALAARALFTPQTQASVNERLTSGTRGTKLDRMVANYLTTKRAVHTSTSS